MSAVGATQIAGGQVIGAVFIVLIGFVVGRVLAKRQNVKAVYWPLIVSAVVVFYIAIGPILNG